MDQAETTNQQEDKGKTGQWARTVQQKGEEAGERGQKSTAQELRGLVRSMLYALRSTNPADNGKSPRFPVLKHSSICQQISSDTNSQNVCHASVLLVIKAWDRTVTEINQFR